MISVIIPCLNTQEYLGAAIRSLLNQSLPPGEIIVADNGSSDRSKEIASSFGGVVRLLEVPERGAPAARTAGFRECTGDAVMFMDADDLIAPDTLRSLNDALKNGGDKSGGGAIACCPWYRLEQSGEAWIVAPASCAPRRIGQDDLSAWLTGWYHPPCSILWSRFAFEDSGGWDTDVRLNQDGDLMMRAFIRGHRLVMTNEGSAFYRRLPGEQVSLSDQRRTEMGIEARLDVLDRVSQRLEERDQLRKYAGPLAEAHQLVVKDCPGPSSLSDRCQERVMQYRELRSPWYGYTRTVQVSLTEQRNSWRRRISFNSGGRAPIPAKTEALLNDCEQPQKDPPLVTVVIPAFNRAATIGDSVRSVLEQDYPNFELLVIDDGSTDGTAAKVQKFEDPRVLVIKQPENRGVSAARNLGIARARGDYIAFLDSDDVWLPGKLKQQVACLDSASSAVGMVITGVETVLPREQRRIDVPAYSGSIFDALLLRNVLHGAASSAVFRREVFDTVGSFDTNYPAIEDYELWLRISRFYQIHSIAEPLVRYFDAGDCVGDEGSLRVSRSYERNRQARQMLFSRYGREMKDRGFDHLFLLNSAERELEQVDGSVRLAIWLAAKAILRRPFGLYSYRWTAMRFLPAVIHRLARG